MKINELNHQDKADYQRWKRKARKALFTLRQSKDRISRDEKHRLITAASACTWMCVGILRQDDPMTRNGVRI